MFKLLLKRMKIFKFLNHTKTHLFERKGDFYLIFQLKINGYLRTFYPQKLYVLHMTRFYQKI